MIDWNMAPQIALRVISVVLLLCGCTEAEPEASAASAALEKMDTHAKHSGSAEGAQGYRKPGADIHFTHDFDGSVEPDIMEEVLLKFSYPHPGARLTVQLTVDDGLELQGGSASGIYVFENEEPAIIPVTLRAQSSGKYYVNVFSTVNFSGASQGRVFSFAVATSDYSGNAPVSAGSQKGDSKQAGAKGNVVLLPAQETITTR